MSLKSIALAAAMTALAASAGFAATVQNGSFEDVSGLANSGLNHGNFGVYNTIPGWTTASGSGIELQNNATLGEADAQDGNWYVELDSHANSSMYQDITFAKAGVYALSFWYAPRTSTPNDNGITYSLGDLVWGQIDDVYPSSWREVTSQFTVANAGDTLRLTFAADGTSNSLGGFIDNVSIAAVPLPASALLLMGAMAGLGGIARRRRKAA